MSALPGLHERASYLQTIGVQSAAITYNSPIISAWSPSPRTSRSDRKLASRAQKKHTCRLTAISRSKSNGQPSLRGATYDESNRLECCSRDPIGYRSGINVFRYCRNRVASLVDPTGLVDIGTGIGGTIGGTIGATIGGAIGGTGGTIGGGVVGTVGGPVGTIGGGVVGGVEGTIVGAGVGGSIGVGVGIGIENLITDIYDGVAEGIDYIIDDIARDQAERSKPIERSRGDRMKSTDDPFTQLEEIEQA